MKDVQVLLDMDGVTANFVHGCMKLHMNGMDTEVFYKGFEGEWELIKIIRRTDPMFSDEQFWKHMEHEFWHQLPLLPDALELISILESRYGQKNITLCSSPSQNVGCISGKQEWIKTHLPAHYHKTYNQMFCAKKWLAANSRTILVDDHNKNVKEFFDHGGRGVLVPRIWNSMHHLRHESLTYVKTQLDFIDAQIKDEESGF